MNSHVSLPDFSVYGYQVDRPLGYNKAGGRVTYLATQLDTQQLVVIKQFQFAQVGISWSDYQAHEREIELLQTLDHPKIPRYLNAFETPSGFCLVQEYKNAPSLAEPKRWTEAQIQQIAIAVLEILVDLQTHEPPIIHRDIKPENLLVDDQLNVYLVDFGFAHLEGEDLAASSTVKGTFGFMPPEQLFNRSLTPASDLYSLGITLISLLTRTPSAAIAELFDDHYRLQFKSRLLQRSPQWSSWLEKMTAANLQQRYPNAAIALQALQGIHKQRPQLSLAGTAALFITLGSIALGLALGELRPAPLPFRSDQQQQIARDLQQLQTTHHCPGCRLAGTNLSGADLRSIDLTGANLAGANLSGADLRGAYLAEANLRGAKLAGANLASTDLRDAIMPDGSIYP